MGKKRENQVRKWSSQRTKDEDATHSKMVCLLDIKNDNIQTALPDEKRSELHFLGTSLLVPRKWSSA